jgi:tetratricopeptide (TPR) repeat protein
MVRARAEFDRVLALDPHHARALLGLARIHIQEQDLETTVAILDRALRCYPDFSEAQALRETLHGFSGRTPTDRQTPTRDHPTAASTPPRERDVLALRTDGHLVLTRTHADRSRQLAQHLLQVYRTASATLSRAGLGSLRGGAIDTGSCMTFLLKDADLVFSATLDGNVEIGAGFAQVGRLKADLGVKA